MKALTVVPGTSGSVRCDDVPEPGPDDGDVLVEVLLVGICGTDLEIAAGEYGSPPAGHDRLVLGHESLGRVVEAPDGSGLAPGDLVVALVRHPDPVPCSNCAAGRWDLCLNGRYTEHGIAGRDGFLRERYRTSPDRLVRLDPGLGDVGVLLEPTSVVAKAWALVDQVAALFPARPRVALVTGAGPIGLLAALLAVERGFDVHVLDRVTDGPKPDLVAALGARYHHGAVQDLDVAPGVVVECTGAAPVVVPAISAVRPAGVACLTGVSSPGRTRPVDLGALNRELVLDNTVVVGSVNAAREHYEAAAAALARADRDWLTRLVTRRVGLADAGRDPSLLGHREDDVKVVVDVAGPDGR